MGKHVQFRRQGKGKGLKHYTRYAGLLLSLIAVFVLIGCGARGGGAQGGGEDGTYTIKFSHVVTPETPKGLAAERFKEVLEENSGGNITVEIYPNSQLYGDEDEMQALQGGSVEMLAPAGAKFGTIASQLQVLDLPFIANSPEEIQEIVSRDSEIGQAIYENEDLAASNIKVLGLWDLGFKQFSSNQPIRTPEDLVGQKMRIQSGSDVLRDQFETWGSSPTPMAFGEVFNALQQGVIDGLENTYANFYSQKMHTVQSHMTESNHGYIGYVFVINNDFFERLPEDLQQAVTDAADEATAYNREVAFQKDQEAKQNIEEAGTTEFITLNEQDRQAFKDQVVPKVWDDYADVIGADIIEGLKRQQGLQ
jgi:C4-dicarboxylate-binding protein DctP